MAVTAPVRTPSMAGAKRSLSRRACAPRAEGRRSPYDSSWRRKFLDRGGSSKSSSIASAKIGSGSGTGAVPTLPHFEQRIFFPAADRGARSLLLQPEQRKTIGGV